MNDRTSHTTVIAHDVLIRGEVTLGASSLIHGRIEGKIDSAGEVTISPDCVCTTDINAGVIIVEGKVEGDLVARDAIELRNSAHVRGDIAAAAISIAEGASFVGQCRIGPSAAAKPEPTQNGSVSMSAARTGFGAGAMPTVTTRPVRTPAVAGTIGGGSSMSGEAKPSDDLLRDPELARLLNR